VVIKGTSCAGARRLAVHLTRTDTNERAEVRELSGVAADDLRGALLEMEAVAAGTRSTKPFYHASINTRADEKLTDEQRAYAIDRLEEKLGLTGQARVVVLHQKEGREHCHIVWSRIDLERMRAISDSHNYRKHEEIARDLERHFGHERVQGAHAEREGKPRPDRTPSHSEMLQAERGAATPEEAKALITAAWKRTDSGQSFKTALEDQNWLLARGDRRDFVVIDPHGGTHSLARRVDGAKAKDIRARMADIDAALLPTVSEARDRQRERQPPERPIAAIQIEHQMAEADQSRTAALMQLQKAAAADAQQLRTSPSGRISSERAFGDAARTQAQEVRNERREQNFWAQQEAWRVSVNEQKPPTPAPVAAKPIEKGLQVVDRASGAVMKLGDFILDFLSGPAAPAPDKRTDMKAFVSDPAARKEQQLARLAASRQAETAEKALESIREDLQAGRYLKSEDIKNLTRQHQEQIRSFGDSAVHQMVDEARKRSESYWKGNERER
jgi:Relaxase/Mobilisation nuclease domain